MTAESRDGEGRLRGWMEKDAGRLSLRGNAEKSPLVGSLGSLNISSISTVISWYSLCSHLLEYLSALEESSTEESLCGVWGKGGTEMGSAQDWAGQGEESGHRAGRKCLEPKLVGSTAAPLNVRGWALLAQKTEAGSLGVSEWGDCVLHSLELHVI